MNVRIVAILIFFIFGHAVGSAQKISVKDSYTNKIIKNVLVMNTTEDLRIYSDSIGSANIGRFLCHDRLIFFHPDYKLLSLKKEDLGTEVYLELSTENLKKVVLSVSKSADDKEKLAQAIHVIARREIEELSPQTSADLIANIPAVRVQKSQLGGGSPVIRGMESNRVLLVVDGVRMNNAIYRKGHLQNAITVSPHIVERAEVVFGPTSVVYGSDALGGVVHYYTKKLNMNPSFKNSNRFFQRFSSVNKESTTSFSSYNRNKKWSSYSALSYSRFGDLEIGKRRRHGFKNWGLAPKYSRGTRDFFETEPQNNPNSSTLKNTGYAQLDVLQKFLFPISEAIKLNANIQYSTSSDIPNYGKLNDVTSKGNLKFAEWFYGPQKRFLASTKFEFKKPHKWINDGNLTLAYQKIEESRIQRKFGSFNRTSRIEKVDVFSVNGDFLYKINNNEKLSYGFEGVWNYVDSNAKGETLSVDGNSILGTEKSFAAQTRYPDGGSKYISSAIYTSYKNQINTKNTFDIGLRYTNTWLNAKWIDQTFITLPNSNIYLKNAALTGSLGWVYKPNINTKISSVLASGFRSPNIDDVGKVREKSARITVPNIHLRPEFAYSYELGIERRLFKKRLLLDIRGYYTLLDNYIVRDVYAGIGESIVYDDEKFIHNEEQILANQNKGQAFVTGGTFSWNYKTMKGVQFTSGVTYTYGRTLDTKEPMSSIPPLFGNFVTTYNINNLRFDIEYRFSLAKTLDTYNLTEGIDNIEETYLNSGTPKWSVLNLNSRYKFPNDLKIQLQIQNILDHHYKEFASSISAPGRNISMSLSYPF